MSIFNTIRLKGKLSVSGLGLTGQKASERILSTRLILRLEEERHIVDSAAPLIVDSIKNDLLVMLVIKVDGDSVGRLSNILPLQHFMQILSGSLLPLRAF